MISPKPTDTIPVLPKDYYLDNFHKLITHALTWYRDLLTVDEQRWIEHFNVLDRYDQCLLVRLLSRKGTWFRCDKLSYEEIPDLALSFKRLSEARFIDLNPAITQYKLASNLLTKPEITKLIPAICADSSYKKLPKSEILEKIPDSSFDGTLDFQYLKLLDDSIIDLLLALFFANTHQDLSQFVLSDLGLHQFEPYSLSTTCRYFSTRKQVEELQSISHVRHEHYASDRKQPSILFDLLDQLPSESSHRQTQRKLDHLVNDIARDFERLEDYDTALSLFAKTSLPPSLERQARIYDKQNDTTSMQSIVENILTQAHDVAELEVGEKLHQRLQRKLGLKVKRPEKPNINRINLQLDLTDLRVEIAVKEHFEQQGWTVFFAENCVLNGLFGLVFWDAIFAPVEGAFVNAYQYKPKDLYQNEFKLKRASLLAESKTKLATQGLRYLENIYRTKYNTANPFVAWNTFTPELLEQCIVNMPPALLLDMFEVVLSDIKLYRNGMPDLIAFREDEFKWIEVKGPGDKLQDNQLRWIRQFNRLDVPFSVCFVNQ